MGRASLASFPGSTSQQVVDNDVAHEVDEEEREAEGVADESADVVREVVVAPEVEGEEADVVEVSRHRARPHQRNEEVEGIDRRSPDDYKDQDKSRDQK